MAYNTYNRGRKWRNRMSSVNQMIGCGLRLKDIAKHYGCTATNVTLAMQLHSKSIYYIRAEYEQKGWLVIN
jgi:hypothetical protein